VDLDDPPPGQAADAERHVERDRAGRDDLDRHPHLVTEAHHRPLAELAVDAGERGVQRLVAVCGSGHVSLTCPWVGGQCHRWSVLLSATLGAAPDNPQRPAPPCGRWDELLELGTGYPYICSTAV